MALDQTTLTALLDTVRKFVRDRLVPLEAQVAREDRIPETIVDTMRELGLFGMTIPEEFGGLGLTTLEECQAQLFTVFARTDPNTLDSKGVSAFLVDATSKGIALGPKNRKMGQQGAHVCDVIFEDCWVPETALLGGQANLNKGFLTAMKTLDRGRLHISGARGGLRRTVDL